MEPYNWLDHPAPTPLPETVDGLDFGTEWKTIYAVQARWRQAAVDAKPERPPFANLDRLTEEVLRDILPHFSKVETPIRLRNNRWTGSAFLDTAAEFLSRENQWVVEIIVRTSGYGAITDEPSSEGFAAVRALAQRWGLAKPNWEPIEKGWGTFHMKVTPNTAIISLLLSMETGEAHDWAARGSVVRTSDGWEVTGGVSPMHGHLYTDAAKVAARLTLRGVSNPLRTVDAIY